MCATIVVMIFAVLVVVGLCLGSFVNALVWRLHEQAALEGKKTKGSKLQATKLSILKGRSMCPHCQHELAVKDLVPVLSWLSLGGKCRYCRKPIGWQYPLVELLTAGLFIFSYIYWPSGFHGAGLLEFVLWLVFLTGLVALFVYDARWFILPNRILYPLIVLAVLQILAVTLFYHGSTSSLLGAVWGALILGGLFYGLFRVSDGQWIGGGDPKLGVLLGLLIGGPLASFLLLFLASSGGTLVALPLLVTGKATRTSKLPFGPLLIIAAIVVRLFGASIIAWYKVRFALS